MAEKCKACEIIQEQLLEVRDDSQVICEHHHTTNIEIEMMEKNAESPAPIPCSSSNTENNGDVGNDGMGARKRKLFLSPKRFAALGGDKVKRKIAPVQKWSTLTVRYVYRIKRVVAMEVIVKQVKQIAHYAQLEDVNEKMINVWITDIIREELQKYTFEENDVYIMPLGKSTSQQTGFSYNDFLIQRDVDMNNEEE